MGVNRDSTYAIMDKAAFYDKYIRLNLGGPENFEAMADLKKVIENHGGNPEVVVGPAILVLGPSSIRPTPAKPKRKPLPRSTKKQHPVKEKPEARPDVVSVVPPETVPRTPRKATRRRTAGRRG
jgi:hypothetical protein